MVDDPNMMSSGWDEEEIFIGVSGNYGLGFICIVCIVTQEGVKDQNFTFSKHFELS
jgi:hypothetical protein